MSLIQLTMIDADYTGSAKERNKNLQTQFCIRV